MVGSTKTRSLVLLTLAEVAGMSLWFTSAAVLPEMIHEAAISAARQAFLSSAVQAGFVVGALISSLFGIPDRFDPRRVFALSALGAAAANLCLIVLPIGGDGAIGARFLTGALLAGVYPVGMKIAVGWGTRDRGLLVGLLVGALTLGNSVPFLTAFLGGTDWRATVVGVSLLAALGGLLVLRVRLGAHHASTLRFEPAALKLAWTDRRIRAAFLGYLGHMWELFSMWAWVGAAAAASYGASMSLESASGLGRLTAFAAIGFGALTCVAGGVVADRFGKAEIAMISLVVSGASALLTAASFGGPPWLTFLLVLIWGISIIPDSPQYSALVADFAPPQLAGSLLTFQTALGFALTILTVQATPIAAAAFGWPPVLAAMALGPVVGFFAMLKLRRSAIAAVL